MDRTFRKLWLLLLSFILIMTFSGCKKNVTITFDAGDGQFELTEYVGKKGQTIENFDNLIPVLEDFEFIGWYESGTNNKWTSKTVMSKNVTLVARYQDTRPALIVYNLDGGTNNPNNPERYVEGFELLDPTKEGYLFDYWEYNGEIVTVIPNVSDNPIVLTAHFSEEKTKLIYELDGASNNANNPERYVPGAELFDPYKQGYEFNYWECNGDIITSIPETTDKVLTITAHFTIIEYTITYELDGGINDERNVTTFTVEDLPLTLYEPTYEGKTFLGWYCDNRKIVNIPTSFCRDLVLNAKFETHYYITYEGECLDTVDNPTTYVSSKGLTLQSPTKHGYTFVGWNWNGYIITEIPAGTTGDITLETIFDLAEYTITYELNGGKNSSKNPKTYTINDKNINLATPVKDGFEFQGWSLDGEIVSVIDVNIAKDITLVAVWDVLPVYHTIVYEMNGGTTTELCEPRYREGVGCVLPALVKDGYTFVGWNTASDGSGTYITSISDSDTADYHLYAIWTKNDVLWNISYELNGGSALNLPNKYTQGKVLVLTTPTKDGYAFDGWYLSNDFTGERITQISADASGDLVLYAKFITINNIYKVIYYLNGGSFTTDDVIYEFTKDTETFSLPSLTRNGYTFVGWVDEDGNRIDSIAKGTENDMVVEAEFTTDDRTYTIKYILNEGTLDSSATYIYKANEHVVLPTASKEGANFIGWHRLPNLTDDVITEITDSSSNLVLYAEYENKVYTITYEVEGENSNPTTYTSYDDNIYLEDAVKEGYEFIGWFNKAGQQVTMIESGSKGDLYLIAKFEPIIEEGNVHTVTFINYDGTTLLTKEVVHGNTVSELIIGQVKGLPLSWYLDGWIYNFDSLVTTDLVLEAKWSIIDDIFGQIFTTPVIVSNLNIKREFDSPVGEISAKWSSDLYQNINMMTGAVNQEYTDTIVQVTGEFTFGGQAFNVKRNITVGKVNFKDLTNYKPVIGYFYSRAASCEITDVTTSTLDIVNYGFGHVKSDCTVNMSELTSIERIVTLRQSGVRVLLCIGGYASAGTNFSLAAKTEAGRKKLANSILSLIIEHHFDGVDIDWEYPGYETGTDVSIDMPNYTLLMQEISDTLKAYNPEYLVTAALPGGKYGYTRYELQKVGQILDYVNLMTYDLQSSTVSTHHTGLYNGNYTPHGSVEQTVEIFSLRGVPKNKQIIGIAFYGRCFNVTSSTDGIGCQNSTSTSNSIRYTDIYNLYLTKIAAGSTTIKRYWDDTTKAPYIYDSSTGVWISYDDPESIKYKCEFVKNNDYGGVMFWDYGEDETLQLIQAIHDNFR